MSSLVRWCLSALSAQCAGDNPILQVEPHLQASLEPDPSFELSCYTEALWYLGQPFLSEWSSFLEACGAMHGVSALQNTAAC